MGSKEAGTPSMATCAAVTMLLPTLSSVLYRTAAADTTPAGVGGLHAVTPSACHNANAKLQSNCMYCAWPLAATLESCIKNICLW